MEGSKGNWGQESRWTLLTAQMCTVYPQHTGYAQLVPIAPLFTLILALSGRWWYWSTFQSEPKEIESRVLEIIAVGQMLGHERGLKGARSDSRNPTFHIYFCVLRTQNNWSYRGLIK